MHETAPLLETVDVPKIKNSTESKQFRESHLTITKRVGGNYLCNSTVITVCKTLKILPLELHVDISAALSTFLCIVQLVAR